ncbi:alpha-1,4-glucan:maltose-1-phosphate maltosyltransferase [Paucimonas lemoignei]|uniref:Alpha-1,4-glucan:maltose-1-phosphate maltosyltransferase n=1 Tax=Paucimonas lemoignei TaxID=29443 RepID=A0A4R3I3V1_PAULE|nr:alpha-1,4-glucan--maltose-1-phosphate maltosyltransferase [Paucimonas lemoignei]TCS39385.1 alpha-1,4-glucan:maltose-1-phosphate maltosyltransferase [Paucimonas lemoignei]
MTISTPFIPKICSLPIFPLTGAEARSGLEQLDAALARAAALGFDHVLLPGPMAQERDIREIAQACARRQLALLVDLDIAGVAPDDALLQTHAHWFAAPGQQDDLPDPRYPQVVPTRQHYRYTKSEVQEEIRAYWSERLLDWSEQGVVGFRCIDVAGVPAEVWKDLIANVRAQQPQVRFLAWTPGCTPAQLDALVGCGFDASFSSAAWWNFRAHWIEEEHARLLRVAPPIAFPDAPGQAVAARAPGAEQPETVATVFRRALQLAAAVGNGWLMPLGFEQGRSGEQAPPGAGIDLSSEVVAANRFVDAHGAKLYGATLRLLSGADADAAILLRNPAPAAFKSGAEPAEALLVLVNAGIERPAMVHERQWLAHAEGLVPQRRLWPQPDQDAAEGSNAVPQVLCLEPGQLQVFEAGRLAPILLPAPRGKQAVVAAAKMPRVAIEAVSPTVDGGRFAVKRVVGDCVTIEADVFTDGHEKLAVVLLWRPADEAEWREVRMHAIGNDRWAASLPLTRLGRHLFAVEAWRDVFATYRDELEKKTGAGLNVKVELEEGRLLVEQAAAFAMEQDKKDLAATLDTLAKSLKVPVGRGQHSDAGNTAQTKERDTERIAALLSEPAWEAMRAADARPFAVRSDIFRIDAERRAARFSSWYELFPRSQSGDPHRHGSFDDVIKRLPAIQDMGFDTLYFTPIHPIGRKHRKGRNNSLDAGPDDPGSPYAIGSSEGGHDAIHPELGTLEDFRRLRDEAARHGLELALDFAIQCSPDHPWLKEHPDWFAWRPDGTIRYAENPPKKYQDIVNVDFYADGAVPGLWIALRDVVLLWVKEGVRVFRVDNPHTKPLPFWEWMINDIRGRFPDVIFLSEAFTRPKMMYRLAKAGYSQSYTYFTWRHTKAEFIEYLTELTTTNVREYFRPHFFVNTPDINPYFLQRSGRPGFLIRAALATTLSGLWGMYSGYELCEGTPVPGKEEYLDSEKYEIRAWDWHRPGNIIREITQLNRIRIENPALQSHLGVRFLQSSDENILYFIKSSEPFEAGQTLGDNVVLVAINLDPHQAHETAIEVPLWELGVPDEGEIEVDDLVGGGRLSWRGKRQQLRLDPMINPYGIWRVRRKGG